MELLEKQVTNRILVNQYIIMQTLDWLVNYSNLKDDLREAQDKTQDVLDQIRNDESN